MISEKALVVLATVFLLGACSSIFFVTGPQARFVADPVIADMISELNETEIYNTVYYLSQTIGSRYYGTAGNNVTSAYLYNRLKNFSGLTVEYQGVYKNVIGTLSANSSKILLVGAHYDTVSGCPGATDNAGGVAIVLELARIMSKYNFVYTVKFAFWNREEGWNPTGATDYVQKAAQNTSLYFNYDSSCYDPNNRFILDVMSNTKSAPIRDMITQHNSEYGIGFTLTYNVHTCTSDHTPFWNAGYTATMTHAETHGSQYHTQYDTVDKISTAYAKKNGQLGMSVLAELAEVQSAPEGHDIEIKSVVPSKTIVGTGFLTSIAVRVRNWGTYEETFTLRTYANATLLNTTVMTLQSGSSAIVTFTWDSTGFVFGNYALRAEADIVMGETDTSDNTLTAVGPVHVGVPGDVTSVVPLVYDGVVDVRDIAYLILVFHVLPGTPTWNPNADVDSNGVIDVRDITTAILHFYEHE